MTSSRRADETTISPRWRTRPGSSTTRGRNSPTTSPPRSGVSARTAPIRDATGTRTSLWAPTCSSRAAFTKSASSSWRAPSAPIRSTRRSLPRGRALERLPRGDERALRGGEEGRARRGAGLPGAVRAEHDLPTARQPLRAARQLRRRELARYPALILKMLDAKKEVVLWGDGSPSREFLYVDDCVEGLLRQEPPVTTAPIRSTSTPGSRRRSASWPRRSPT